MYFETFEKEEALKMKGFEFKYRNLIRATL